MDKDVQPQETSVGASDFRPFEMFGSMSVPIFTHNDVQSEISSVAVPNENVGPVISAVQSSQNGQVTNNAGPVISAVLSSQNSQVTNNVGPVISAVQSAQNGQVTNNTVPVLKESFVNPAINSDVGHGVKVEDALSYLEKVRCRYIRQPQIYYRFIDVMREFKTQSLDTLGVIRRITELLQDSPDLISDFNVFIPEDYRCTPKITPIIINKCQDHKPVEVKTKSVEVKTKPVEVKTKPVPIFVENVVHSPVKVVPVRKEPIRVTVTEEIIDYRELDPSMCRRLGQSYCQAPKNYLLPKCSGRTSICDEVLNDEWLSVPLLSDTAAGIRNKKLPNEKRINQIEDQRFELDFVIQTNLDAIKYLKVVESSMKLMSPEELNNFQLDEYIGSRSTIHLRAVRRIYGDAAAPEIIEGLVRCPKVAVPIVLKRLEGKDEEWRAEQRKFNKVWRDEMERYNHKSLDLHASKFKQRDLKSLRSKSLLAEIETTKSD